MRITAEIIDEDPADDPLDRFSRHYAIQSEPPNVASAQFTTKTQMKHHFLNMHEEMTQKFKNLHLSDMSFSNKTNADMASSSNPMESTNPMENAYGFSNDLESAPAWLQQYLLKMKHEIKKEVLEELLQSGSSEETNSSKLASAMKLHEIQDEIVHNGIYCDNCDQIIQGIRYKCVNCSDFDLCQECESLPYIHNAYHIFLKVRHPLPLRLKPLEEPPGNRAMTKAKKPQTKKLYEARFIKDDTIPDSTVLLPSTQFVKSWRIMNSGTRVWNHSTKLQLIQGSAELTPTSEQVDVPHLRPGEVGVVSVVFTTPPYPGLYRSHWNFCHKSRPFGDIVWCHIIVHADGSKAGTVLAEKPTGTPKIILPPKKTMESKQNEASCIEQVLTAVRKEHERGNMVPRKVVATSHTATPNNTPFDITPPKSPDHHETTAKELNNLIPNNISSAKVSDNEEDKCSVVSLGSSESDTEFVVIPMPKCFNMSESFLSQDIPQWVRSLSQELGSGTFKPEILEAAAAPEGSKNASKRPSLTSETVSQETGVPELSVEQTVLKIVEQEKERAKVNYVSVLTDGSSSEISIIESEESSPVVENAPTNVGTIDISLSSESAGTNCDVDRVEVQLDNRALDERAVEEILDNEEAANIPSSATFPKFPVEGITSTFDPDPVSNEERTIQVLPEGLVTGALSAAASVYNTARAAINAMQQTRIEQGVVLSQNPTGDSSPNSTLNPMEQLIEMGFCDRSQNEELLRKHNGDVALVVAELVNQNDNDWYNSRHFPPRPPA